MKENRENNGRVALRRRATRELSTPEWIRSVRKALAPGEIGRPGEEVSRRQRYPPAARFRLHRVRPLHIEFILFVTYYAILSNFPNYYHYAVYISNYSNIFNTSLSHKIYVLPTFFHVTFLFIFTTRSITST